MHQHAAPSRTWRTAVALGAVALLCAALLATPPAGAAPASGADDKDNAEQGGASASSNAPHRPDELLVRFDPTTPEAEKERIRKRHRLVKVEDVPLAGLELVRTTGKGTPPERARQVSRERTVRYAQPNYLWFPSGHAPADPEFGELWGLHNTGQSGGTADADIDWPEARHDAVDTSGIVVAVIDTGVQTDHPDLAGAMWVNDDPVGDADGDNDHDDDGNGFVDDVHGWDFFNDDATVFDMADGDEHGTHVAGTIAAVADNSVAVAGVSKAKIMSLKFLGPEGGSTADAIAALDYAIDNKARVTNNSWGGGPYDAALAQKIQEAADAGILFVAAAGNSGVNIDSTASYPASYPHASVVAVANTTRTDGLASSSNYGSTSVDLGAPGTSILSTVPRSTKTVLADHATQGRSAFHSFGLEGVLHSADRNAVMRAAIEEGTGASAPSILLVDDDDGSSYEPTYEAAITGAGYSVTNKVATGKNKPRCSDGPSATTLNDHDVVVWFTGADYSCTLTATDRANLETYLDQGGVLALFGEDLAYGLREITWVEDVLGARYASDSNSEFVLVGEPGTAYAGLTVELADSGTVAQQFANLLEVAPGGTAALRGEGIDTYSGTSMAAPHVTGAVAHVLAKYPQLPITDVKARLMSTGDAIASLAGKTVSGRRLNLDRALTDATITGTVTAEGGSGLGGICVKAWAEPAAFPSFQTTTGSDGAYSLQVPTGTYRVQFIDCNPVVSYATEWYAGAADWFSATSVDRTSSSSDTVDAVLGTAFTVSGTVTSAATESSPSTALGDICVRVYTAAGTLVDAGTTAADGTYTLTGFGPGEHWARFHDCSGSGYATQWYNGAHDSADRDVFAISGSVGGIDAAMVAARTISGKVISASTGAALVDICVTAWAANGGHFIARVRTGADGTYTVGGMGPASFKLRFDDCSGRGFGTEWYSDKSSFSAADAVDVTTGSQTGINAGLS